MSAHAIILDDVRRVLSHTLAIWPGLTKASVFVTGSTGFFGVWILEILLAANREFSLDLRVVALSRNPAAFAARAPVLANDPAVTWVIGDVRDFPFPNIPITHIIHAATESTSNQNASDPQAMFDVCVEGTRRVLALSREKAVQHVLFTSSGAVYGRQPPELSHLSEDFTGGPDPLDRRNAYAEGKRAAEFLCGLAASDPIRPVPVTIARCFAFVGPHLPLDVHFAIGNFVRDALNGGPIRVSGDGTPYRSYLYSADLVEWLVTILLRGRPGRAYNVGSEQAISIGELAGRVAHIMASGRPDRGRPEVTFARQAVPGALAARYVPSCQRCRDELSLVPRTSLDDAIARSLRWWAC